MADFWFAAFNERERDVVLGEMRAFLDDPEWAADAPEARQAAQSVIDKLHPSETTV